METIIMFVDLLAVVALLVGGTLCALTFMIDTLHRLLLRPSAAYRDAETMAQLSRAPLYFPWGRRAIIPATAGLWVLAGWLTRWGV